MIGEGEKVTQNERNHSSYVRHTKAHIFCVLGRGYKPLAHSFTKQVLKAKNSVKICNCTVLPACTVTSCVCLQLNAF